MSTPSAPHSGNASNRRSCKKAIPRIPGARIDGDPNYSGLSLKHWPGRLVWRFAWEDISRFDIGSCNYQNWSSMWPVSETPHRACFALGSAGRDFSAWIGLVPKQSSSGGKSKLGSPIENSEYTMALITTGRALRRRRADVRTSAPIWDHLLQRRGVH